MTKRWPTHAFIAVFVVFQLAVPLTYYVRADPYDERFAWRMFSGVRMQKCDTRALVLDESGKEVSVDLMKTIHVAWIKMMKRNRPAVMRAFLERQCREPETERARLENHCTHVDGTEWTVRKLSLYCATGEWSDTTEPAGP